MPRLARTRGPALIACFLLAPVGAPRVAGQESGKGAPGEEPVLEEDSGRPPGIEGTLRLSDGKVLEGRISLSEGQKLRIYDARARRPYYLELAQIAAIRTLVQEERLEEAWAFEEEGFRRKVKLGWKYPLRNYGHEVELRDGPVIVGRIYAAAVYLEGPGGESRFTLPRQDKGKRGQTLGDLVYLESVELRGQPGKTTSRPAARELAALEGRVPGLSAAAAIDLRTLRGAAARAGADGALRLESLLPGPYSLFLRRGGEVAVGFPARLELSAEERAALEARVRSIEEFFDEKKPVLLGGGRERVWVLLELTRSGGTTLSDERGQSFRFRRWEVWVMRADGKKGGDGSPWRIESRIYLDRLVLPAAEPIPPCRYRIDPPLEKVELRPGRNALPGAPPPG